MDAANLARKLTIFIINPLMALLFAAGLLVFIFGIVEYIWGLSTDAKDKEKGKQHMLWGIIGMFVMVAAYSIFKLIAGTLNVTLPSL
jgi:predicted membrane channel-forming protein YqfA (hemolysin III family)